MDETCVKCCEAFLHTNFQQNQKSPKEKRKSPIAEIQPLCEVYGSSPFRSTLNTSYITFLGHVWSMYLSSPLRSTLNTGYITTLDMCEVCTEAVHSVPLWTRVTSQLFGHAWSMYGRSPLRSTLNRGCITASDMCEVYRGSPFRSTLNTSYITALDMCEVCTEAVHSVALWTRVTSHFWGMCEVCTEAVCSVALWTRVTSKLCTCVRYVPKQKQEQEQKQGRRQQQQQQQQ